MTMVMNQNGSQTRWTNIKLPHWSRLMKDFCRHCWMVAYCYGIVILTGLDLLSPCVQSLKINIYELCATRNQTVLS